MIEENLNIASFLSIKISGTTRKEEISIYAYVISMRNLK